MTLPTEPIENGPRPAALRQGMPAPFGDDTSTSRDTPFAKIAACIEGPKLASEEQGV